jgi:nicotinate-nucleotide adenylyltransferase
MIGILGGTFDPPHLGHLTLAESVYCTLGLSQVRWIPLYQAVHKTQPQASAIQRLALVQAAISSQPAFCVDTSEIERGGPSYMVDTLTTLQQRLPNQTLCLIIGSDTFSQLDHWKQPTQLLQLSHLIVVQRANQPLTPPDHLTLKYTDQPTALRQCSSGLVYQHTLTPPAISSTAIRQALAQGDQTVVHQLPHAVRTLIQQQRLYQATSPSTRIGNTTTP